MTSEPIVFPDAVDLVITFLDDQLEQLVTKDVPNDRELYPPTGRPAEFVTVQRTGGPRRNLVTDEPQLTISAYSETSFGAQELAQRTRAWLHTLPGRTVDGVAFYRVDEFAGPQDLPDPLTTQSRYTFSATVALRGAVLTGS